MNQPTILVQSKTRMFTLATDTQHMTAASSMNGNIPSRAYPPYSMTFNTHNRGSAAYQLSLAQAEDLANSIAEMRAANTAKNIIVTLDGIQIVNDTQRLAILDNVKLAEYRTENTCTVKTLTAQNTDTIKKEIAAQAKLQQVLQGFTRNIQILTLKECEHVQTLLESVS